MRTIKPAPHKTASRGSSEYRKAPNQEEDVTPVAFSPSDFSGVWHLCCTTRFYHLAAPTVTIVELGNSSEGFGTFSISETQREDASNHDIHWEMLDGHVRFWCPNISQDIAGWNDSVLLFTDHKTLCLMADDTLREYWILSRSPHTTRRDIYSLCEKCASLKFNPTVKFLID